MQGRAKPRRGTLPKQTSQAVPLVHSPLQGALKVFIWLLSAFLHFEVGAPWVLVLHELSERDRAGNAGSAVWTECGGVCWALVLG